MLSMEECRRLAEECVRDSRRVSSPSYRQDTLTLARPWRDLAKEHEQKRRSAKAFCVAQADQRFTSKTIDPRRPPERRGSARSRPPMSYVTKGSPSAATPGANRFNPHIGDELGVQ
jgi:hypothetical protein